MNPQKQTAVPIIERPAEIEPSVNYDELKGFEPKHIVWLRLLWSERRFLARVTLYGAVITALIALILPPRYESIVKLMPPDQQSGSGLGMVAMMEAKNSLGSMGNAGGSLAGMASDLLGLRNSSALFTEMLGSRTVQDRMVQKFDLRKEYGDRYWQDARKHLAQHTDISIDRKSDVTSIIVTDRDPLRAQQMAQAYVEELNRLLADVSTSAARRERIFIEQRLQTVKADLDRISKQFSEYESQHTVLDLPSQAKAMVEAGAELQAQLIAAQSQLESLEQIYTANNVRVRSTKARVDELKSQLAKMTGSSGNSASAVDQSSSAGELYPPIRQLPLLGVRWLDFYRASKVQETVYELLTQQYELAKVQEAKEIPTAKVLDAANLPERKSFPKRRLMVLVGTFLAFSLGTAVVLGSARWREIDSNSPEKQFLTEIWGSIAQRFLAIAKDGFKPRTLLDRLRSSNASQDNEN